MSNKIYTVKFPLEVGIGDVGYNSTTDLKETIEYNLKSTLLTNPGEVMSDPEFGVGLGKILFEFPTPETIENLRRRMIRQIKFYIPYIKITRTSIKTSVDMKELNLSITYKISSNKAVETFNFSVELPDI
jgi:phage baseplate assembly protein W